MKLPESFIEELRALVSSEDANKFKTCEFVSNAWEELGEIITLERAKEEGWKEGEAKGKAHRWFLASIAAHVGLGYQTMNNRQRVGDNVIKRGYLGGENESISYQGWVSLLTNAEKNEDGLILREVLEDRIAWYQETADNNQGQPPSVLDIQNKYRKNGEDPEWLLVWKRIIRIAKNLLKIEKIPAPLKQLIEWLLFYADADFIGG